MALYEVTLRQRYYDQLCINVWSYRSPAGLGFAPNSLELLTFMGFIPTGDPLALPADTIGAMLQDTQNTGTEWLSVEARELYSLTDFYEAAYSPTISGQAAAGDNASPLLAYGLYSNRVRTDIRRAFKRFVGVGETAMTDGGDVTATFLGYLNTLSGLMSEVFEGITGALYSPAVISRERLVDVDGKVTYELYESEAEQEEHTASGITFAPYSKIRSQTSRQFGRGQ